MKHQFRSRKDASKFLAEKGIDTSNWSEEKWLSINKGQAEIHIMALAEAMWDAKKESTPKELKAGEWHIPFDEKIEGMTFFTKTTDAIEGATLTWIPIPGVDPGAKEWRDLQKVKVSTAMCARTSYTIVGKEDKQRSYEADLELHDRLAESGHWSPFEHCARVMDDMERNYYYTSTGPTPDKFNSAVLGNFRGFIQYRKMFENENIL